MECVIPFGEIYFQYPTRSSMMLEVVWECLRMLKMVQECLRIISNEYSPKKKCFSSFQMYYCTLSQIER